MLTNLVNQLIYAAIFASKKNAPIFSASYGRHINIVSCDSEERFWMQVNCAILLPMASWKKDDRIENNGRDNVLYIRISTLKVTTSKNYSGATS